MKRALDIVLSLSALVLLAPLWALIAVLVWGYDGRPILFRQERVGQAGRLFQMVKFRTMRDGSGPAITASGDPRVTRMGALLRRWKLDELPQLWNVLRGDMSLVGPRPEVPRYVEDYSESDREVLRVRPGITGPAQLAGFDEEEELRAVPDPDCFYREILLPRKLEIDRRYARDAGLRVDLEILLRTARRVLRRRAGAPRATRV